MLHNRIDHHSCLPLHGHSFVLCYGSLGPRLPRGPLSQPVPIATGVPEHNRGVSEKALPVLLRGSVVLEAIATNALAHDLRSMASMT